MPKAKYTSITFNGSLLDLPIINQLGISLSYSIEDVENFQRTTSNTSYGISVPATTNNDQVLNTFHDVAVEDLTTGSIFEGNSPCVIESDGYQLLNGKAFIVSASHTNKPEDYEIDCYGGNANWIIALKDATLYDFLRKVSFPYSTAAIMASWLFDGTNEQLPYVFAPVRYSMPFDGNPFVYTDAQSGDPAIYNQVKLSHYVCDPTYLRPSISKYWIIYWAFQSIGYKISSVFMDTPYFRRQVMPWVWGAFPSSEGTLQEVHKFNAASYVPGSPSNYFYFDAKDASDANGTNMGYNRYVDLNPVVDPHVLGTYDNNSAQTNGLYPDYRYDVANKELTWKYQPNQSFGVQNVTLSMTIEYKLTANHNNDASIDVDWFFNNTTNKIGTTNAGGVDAAGYTDTDAFSSGPTTVYFTQIVSPGDIIIAKVHILMRKHKLPINNVCTLENFKISSFQFEYFKTPINQGGTINFNDYSVFKKYKFFDLLSGVIDESNLSLNVDANSQTVFIEPAHDHFLNDNQTVKQKGYFNGNFLDWEMKQDVSKKSVLTLHNEGSRQLVFRYKDDTADNGLANVQARIQSSYSIIKQGLTNASTQWAVTDSMLAAAKYVLPARFQLATDVHENRFFAPSMHYKVLEWQAITGIAPQIMCIIDSSDVSSASSADSTSFIPKSAYYKGLVSGVGGWYFNATGTPIVIADVLAANENVFDPTPYARTEFPFMFSVNHNVGGENDPVLSYSDEKIDAAGGYAVAKGLMKRFFLQRMAIQRSGKYYKTYFQLTNSDIANFLHREHIVCRGQRWELTQINGYKPMTEDSTECNMRKWSPIEQKDIDACYPTAPSVLGAPNNTDIFETKYAQLISLKSDIPE